MLLLDIDCQNSSICHHPCVCVHCQRDYCRLWLDLTPLPQTCFRYCRKPQCKSYNRYQEQLRSTGCYYGQRNSDEVCKAQFAKRILQQIELHFIYVCKCTWNKKINDVSQGQHMIKFGQLKHWGGDTMAHSLQTSFSSLFSCMKLFDFDLPINTIWS